MSADARPPFKATALRGRIGGLIRPVINAGHGILVRRRQATAEAPPADSLVNCKPLLQYRGDVIADYHVLDVARQLRFSKRWQGDLVLIAMPSLPQQATTKPTDASYDQGQMATSRGVTRLLS